MLTAFLPVVNHEKKTELKVGMIRRYTMQSTSYHHPEEPDFDEMPLRHIHSPAVQLSVPSPAHPSPNNASPLFSPFQLNQYMPQHKAQPQSDKQQQQQRLSIATKPSPSAIPDKLSIVPAT
ncbi:hypothetical protein EST38_g6667 [Candolleomyces aberdarensis]|uniref:Uncharacterized protein n=1 Tax=Candolleomyces aberdarensis TaxID=2316362 RepID=A0A4Q2DK10_9AGAR|nr:hypothetical protein EST38_g6667 [Candolleomyces aberdarensis]